jgi:hypothetical protein
MKRNHPLFIIIRMYPTSPSIIMTRGCQFYWWWKPEYPEKTTSLYHIMVHQVDLTWVGFELTTLVVICTDGIGSCNSNYHTITTTTASYISSIRLVVSSIRLVVSITRLVIRSIRLVVSSIRLVVSSIRLVVSSIRLVVSSIRLVVSSIRLVVSSIRLVISSIRLVVSSIRLVVSSIRLVVSSHRTTLTTWPPVTTSCLVYYIFYGD